MLDGSRSLAPALRARTAGRAHPEHAGRPLLVAGMLVLCTAPLVRTFVVGVPVYLGDLVLLVLAAVFLRPRRLPPGQRALLAWGAVFVASMLPSLAISLVAYDQPAFTIYYFGRRVLALTAFATFLVLFSSGPEGRRLRDMLAAALFVASLWCVGQVLTRSSGPVGARDRAYYDVLVQPVLEPSVNRWAASWKTARAVGGWWNANTAGAALSLLLAAVTANARSWRALPVTGVAWLAIVATGSRQAVVAAALVSGTLLIGRRGERRGRLAGAALLGLAAAVGLAGDQLARLGGAVEGGLGEGVASRWNNYPEFLDAVLGGTPLTFLLGRGAESWAVVERTGAPPDGGAFVSNSLLLTLGENGVVSLLFLGVFLVQVLTRARVASQRAIVVVAVWLLNCDNHLYLNPGLLAVMTMALALAAAPPPAPVAPRGDARWAA